MSDVYKVQPRPAQPPPSAVPNDRLSSVYAVADDRWHLPGDQGESGLVDTSTTYRNLQAAMREEALAAFKYRVYAAKAATAGLQQVADIFNETADNEQEHGEQWMKLLSPFGDVPDTLDNLLDAVASEHAEWATQYAVYTDVARNEGYRKLADKFAAIGAIEAQHEARYNKLVDRLRSGTEFDNGRPTVWICRKCGHQDYAAAPDNVCPVCGHPQGYFERIAENY